MALPSSADDGVVEAAAINAVMGQDEAKMNYATLAAGVIPVNPGLAGSGFHFWRFLENFR